MNGSVCDAAIQPDHWADSTGQLTHPLHTFVVHFWLSQHITAELHIGHEAASTAYLAHVADIFGLCRRQADLPYQLLHFSNLRNTHLSQYGLRQACLRAEVQLCDTGLHVRYFCMHLMLSAFCALQMQSVQSM